ncbi:MAG: hypothetical protein QXY45_02675 [Candidatus Aenigmatarchaeota archaeon]
MSSVIHNENKIIIPVLGVIFLVAVVIVSIQHFLNVGFGILGFISWIIVILGAIYFVLWVFAQIFSW